MISTILLTRPQDRANNLKSKLLDRGYKVIELPCLDIKNLNQSELIKYNPMLPSLRFADVNMAIFVSVNAVHGFFKLYPDVTAISQATIMAIGNETANVLKQYGVHKVSFPLDSEQTSEYFVNLPELIHIANQKILLVRGETSREYISKTIRERKGDLHELVVYKTTCPDNLTQDIELKLNNINSKQLLILITSNSILENFYHSLDTDTNRFKLHSFLTSKLLVVSERIANLAREHGFHDIIVSNTMNEASIIDMIDDVSC